MFKVMRKSMANRIALLISVIFTLTLVLIGILSVNSTYQEILDNKIKETALKAESISKDVKSIFENARTVTRQLALHPEVEAYLKTAVSRETIKDNPYYEATLKTLLKIKESSSIYFLAWVANEKANFYLDSMGVIPDQTYDVKKRPWYNVGMNAAESAFTPPYVEWGTGRVVISCIKPMREGSAVYGFVVMDIVLENIPSIFQKAQINDSDKSFLVTASGDYIYHDQAEKIMKANINDTTDALYPYVKWINETSTGLKKVQYEGKHYYLESYQVDENGWKVINLIDEGRIQAELKSIVLTIIGFLTLIFLATLLAVYFTVRKTMEPYQEVLLFAGDIASGEFTKNIPDDYLEREDEMGELSRSFQIIIDAFRNENIILEERIAEKNQELENQYAFILETEKAASLGTLVAGVAHEINTPVGVSLTTASYLKKMNDEYRKMLADGSMNKENLKELMSVIDESVRLLNNNLERAANLVKNFKQLAVDQSSGSLARFDLKENIDGVVISLFHEYKNLPVTIENHCPNYLFLNTFPGATSQIITNLIMNSLHHGLKDRLSGDKLAGKIDIFAIQKEDWIHLIYADNGKGISKENLKKMYDPFFTTNRVNGNSGLGMHIVLSLVTQKLKGNIHCESEVGEGVKFTIEFPMELERKANE